ncbi:MAG TPA: cation:proton antiporter [Kofleriaceae bacterium]
MIPLLLLLAVGGLMQAARSFLGADVAGTELAFGYLLLVAYFTSKILSRIGLPKLTGYIIAGIVSGPFVLKLVTVDMTAALKVVSNAATAIIALEAGSKLNLKAMRPIAGTLRALTVFATFGAIFALTAVLFVLRPFLPFFDQMTTTQSLATCAVIGIVLSAKSPAVVVAMLAEMRAEGPLSQVMLASVVVADLTVIVVFSIASAVASAVIGGGVDVVATSLSVAWELFGSMAFGVAIGMLIGQFLISVRTGAPLFALMVCVVVAEVGARVHLDPLIVNLTAGIWLRNLSRADTNDLLHGFESAQLPVFLVFFALAGSHLDIYALSGSILVVGALVVTRATSFFLGGRFATKVSHAPDVVRKYAWFGLVPQAGLALALATVLADTFPTFGKDAAVLVVGVVGANEMLAPVILRALLLRSGEAGKKQGVDFAAGGH